MDLEKLISDVLEKLNLDKNLVAKFKKDPMGTVKELLASLNLDTDQLKAIVEGVTAKLKVDDVVDQGKGLLGFFKKLFGK